MLRQIGEALGAAHAVGLVHCDLKPEKRLLATEGTDRITLIDFGLQELMETGQRRALYSRGDYVAPELLAGEPARPAADVYALGGMAAEMLPGRYSAPDRDDAERGARGAPWVGRGSAGVGTEMAAMVVGWGGGGPGVGWGRLLGGSHAGRPRWIFRYRGRRFPERKTIRR